MSNTVPYSPFSPMDCAILLVDQQPGVLAMARSVPEDVVTKNAGMLARLGEELGIPLLVTSTQEDLDFLGTNLTSIQKGAPKAYATRVRRAGTLNAFDDPTFVSAVTNLNRRHLVMSGLLTDVCLFHSVASALAAGYNVQVVADASGTTSELADSVTYDRLRDMGAVITTAYGVLFELYSDLSTPEGKRAQAVATASQAQA